MTGPGLARPSGDQPDLSLDPDRPDRFHFIGLGGIGMSALARYLRRRGQLVSGSDQTDSPLLDELRAEGITVSIGHLAERLLAAGPAQIVVSAAIRPDNVEVVAARTAGWSVATLAEIVGRLTSGYRTLAIAGTHGKTTTTSMLAYGLLRAGQDPSYLVGGLAPDLGGNAHFGSGSAFVIEADEYAGRFLTLRPTVAVITSIEHDHPDWYPDLSSLEAAFADFLERVRPGGLILLRADDAGCRQLGERLRPANGVRVEWFGLADPSADWQATPLPPAPPSGSAVGRRFHLRGPGGSLGEYSLQLPGDYNVANALAAVAAGASTGLDPASLAASLADFRGVGRRFEAKGSIAGVRVFDDYAHHPSELRAMLGAARQRFPTARLWCLFQPHTYSRTRLLFDEFASALRLADRAVVCPVYAAREAIDATLTPASLAMAVGASAQPAASVSAAVALAVAEVRPGDIVLTVGAGDITSAGPLLLAALEGQQR